MPVWPWLFGALVLLAGAALAWRRRSKPYAEAPERTPSPAEPAPPALAAEPTPAPAPAAPPTAASAPARASLEVIFTPRRAGTNLTSAAIDYALTVRNAGDAPARDIRVGISMLTAQAAQEREIDRMFAAPVERPVIAPFALAPGEETLLEGMAMLPRASVNVIELGDRQLFAPLFLVNLLYKWGQGEGGQTARADLVGIDQGADARLGAFGVDRGPRMYDRVTARVHRGMRR